MSDRPEFVEPMKALGRETVPTGIWRCEIKFDGYRAIAVLAGKKVELWSRNRKTLSADYPEIVAALRRVRCRSAVLDGEIAALDDRGRSRFQLLQARALGSRPQISYYVFDLLHLDGSNLAAEPIEERSRRLKTLLKKPKPPLQLSPAFAVAPARLMQAARRQGLEGIIAKRPGSRYEAGRRSGAWVKCKVHGEQEFVIGGFTPPQRSRPHFGAILVGYYHDGRLIYAGKVGTGFNHATLAELHRRFERLRRMQCPFADLPRERKPRFGAGLTAAGMRRVTWLRPALVAQVKFAEWTQDGLLRQPVFLGLRMDKRAREVRREPGGMAHGRRARETRQ
ncbi:MAG TPA: non-homologous end-joining DNA ligase [Candidatus Didemnitutus sp.]|jgi:bifunctional non-homologous end joining protein LigD